MQNTIEKVLPAAAKNRKAAQSEITRAKIVDMAEKMFAKDGVEGVSLRQIRVAIGSAHSNVVTYHFGSKEALIEAIIQDRHTFLERRRADLLGLVRQSGQLNDLNALTRAVWYPLYELTNADGDHAYSALQNTIGWHALRKDSRPPVESELGDLIAARLPKEAHDFFEERLMMSYRVISASLEYCDKLYGGKSAKAEELFEISMRMATAALATP
jgi:AcrR family transcriptional regulator